MPGSRLPHVLLALFAAGLLLAFLWFRDLPMVDLPQHAAQLSTWLNWDDPRFQTGRLELNLRTPYLLGYFVALGLAQIVGAVTALKFVVWLAVASYAFCFSHLVQRLGHNPWLGLLGLPTALGYSYYFGFVSFLVAAPLGLLCISAGLWHAERPSLRRGLLLAALLCATLAAHGVVFFVAGCTTLPLLWRGKGTRVARLAPAMAPALLGMLWIFPGSSMQRMGADIYDIGPWRLAFLPGYLLGAAPGDPFGVACGLAVLGLAAAALGRPQKAPERWLPLAAVISCYLLFPAQLRGYGFMWPRFATFVLPALLIAFRPHRGAQDRQRYWLRPALFGLTAAWLFGFLVRLGEFNREAASFHALAAHLRPSLDIRSLVFDRESTAFPGVPLFIHFPAYYRAQAGGKLGHSFAMYPNSVVRYRPGIVSQVPGGGEWAPQWFDARREAARYDYVIVRSFRDRTDLFANTAARITLAAREGAWWAYRVARGHRH